MTSCDIVLTFVGLMCVHRMAETYLLVQQVYISDVIALLMCGAGILIA
jgi:hypothetical protein